MGDEVWLDTVDAEEGVRASLLREWIGGVEELTELWELGKSAALPPAPECWAGRKLPWQQLPKKEVAAAEA